MLDDVELLRRYAHQQDESAFSALVARHVNLVYSAARRQSGGDAGFAEDVAQAVFTDLARKAATLATAVAGGKPLTGWLYTSTRFAANSLRRAEKRRQAREHTAHAMNADSQLAPNGPDSDWADLAPLLDEAMSQLPQKDRDAVLLRFFEGKDLRGVGLVLGLSEDAARKRVSRALEQLRLRLAARGISTTIAALSATLMTQAVQVAPVGLATKLAKASLLTGTTITTASTLGSLLLMSIPFKISLTIAVALLLAGGIAYRLKRSNGDLNATNSVSSPIVPLNEGKARVQAKVNAVRVRSKPTPEPVGLSIDAALAKIRTVLAAPGRIELYPQPEMKKAILELREHYQEAIPILREALRGPDWGERRRAAAGLDFLSIAASDAVPDLIEMLRDSPTIHDALRAAVALQSIGVKEDAIPDLVKALEGNQHAREGVDGHFPNFLKETSKKATDAASGDLLDRAVAKLTTDSDDTRLNGLLSIAGLGPVAIAAIPALKEFIGQPNREDLKMYAEKLLAEIDPNFGSERDDPALQEAQAERARAFSEKARAGQATVQELITALRELPQAIPAAAQALGAIGYEEMSRRSHESPQSNQEFVDATIMLTQIAASNQPLESRLAASEAFRQLQPMREKLLYTAQEASPAFAVISNALPRLSEPTRNQVESRFNMMLDGARIMWLAQQRPGDITDYQGSFLETYARELTKMDTRTYGEFVAAMRKTDPKFLQQP